MAPRVLVGALLAVLLGALPAAAQQPDPNSEEWKGGRVKFAREQGSEAELREQLVALLAALGCPDPVGVEDPDAEATPPEPAKPPKATPKPDGEGLPTPPPARPKDPAPTPPAAAKPDPKAALAALKKLAPTPAALQEVLGKDGNAALGEKVLAEASALFAGEDAAEIAKRLGLDPALRRVEVYRASTEDLLTMDYESAAAREFASALRRTARLLPARFHFYAVVLRRTPDDTQPVRLQLFVRAKDRYVYLGRIWKLDE